MSVPITDRDVRCWRCRRAIAVVATRPWLFKCHKCNAVNGSPPASAPARDPDLTRVAAAS